MPLWTARPAAGNKHTSRGTELVAPPLLDIRNLTVCFATPSGPFRALRDVSLELQAGETLAIVGETGCGKTTLALSIPGLLDGGWIEGGVIRFEGETLSGIGERKWRRIRGRRIGLVFQNPRASLNPVLRVEEHLLESMRAHRRVTRAQARESALALLGELGVPDPAFVLRRYSSELSGGICQRIAIALAVCNAPSLLIADEPTSALDPTIQSQIIALLKEMKRLHGLSLLFISHDLLLISGFADRVAVMYGGRVVELGPAEEVLARPAHPYTCGLVGCIPDTRQPPGSRHLRPIPGFPPARTESGPGCVFASRCTMAEERCASGVPDLVPVSNTHRAACVRITPGVRS